PWVDSQPSSAPRRGATSAPTAASAAAPAEPAGPAAKRIEARKAARKEPSAARDDLLAGHRVLIVDDDVRNIFALSSVLEQHGMQMAFAESGKAALELLKAEHGAIGAVLMDIMMPKMDGYKAIRAIRALPGFRALPIIAV